LLPIISIFEMRELVAESERAGEPVGPSHRPSNEPAD
jgi:hypothetical protein